MLKITRIPHRHKSNLTAHLPVPPVQATGGISVRGYQNILALHEKNTLSRHSYLLTLNKDTLGLNILRYFKNPFMSELAS